jgi:hypothetical protein
VYAAIAATADSVKAAATFKFVDVTNLLGRGLFTDSCAVVRVVFFLHP